MRMRAAAVLCLLLPYGQRSVTNEHFYVFSCPGSVYGPLNLQILNFCVEQAELRTFVDKIDRIILIQLLLV